MFVVWELRRYVPAVYRHGRRIRQFEFRCVHYGVWDVMERAHPWSVYSHLPDPWALLAEYEQRHPDHQYVLLTVLEETY